MVNGQWPLQTPSSSRHSALLPTKSKICAIGHHERLDVLNQSQELQGSGWQDGVPCPPLKPGAVLAPGNHEVETKMSFKDQQESLAEGLKQALGGENEVPVGYCPMGGASSKVSVEIQKLVAF